MKKAIIIALAVASALWSQTTDSNGRTLATVTYANLGTPANGTMYYCSNCTAASPTGSGGTGVVVRYENGQWNGSGGGIAFPQTVSGTTTSGGIPYLSSTTVLSSSGFFVSKHVLLGGGAGAAPTSDSALDDGATTANTLTYTGSGGMAVTGGPWRSARASGGDRHRHCRHWGIHWAGVRIRGRLHHRQFVCDQALLSNNNATAVPIAVTPATTTNNILPVYSGTWA